MRVALLSAVWWFATLCGARVDMSDAAAGFAASAFHDFTDSAADLQASGTLKMNHRQRPHHYGGHWVYHPPHGQGHSSAGGGWKGGFGGGGGWTGGWKAGGGIGGGKLVGGWKTGHGHLKHYPYIIVVHTERPMGYTHYMNSYGGGYGSNIDDFGQDTGSHGQVMDFYQQDISGYHQSDDGYFNGHSGYQSTVDDHPYSGGQQGMVSGYMASATNNADHQGD